jgi:hypothetical protein
MAAALSTTAGGRGGPRQEHTGNKQAQLSVVAADTSTLSFFRFVLDLDGYLLLVAYGSDWIEMITKAAEFRTSIRKGFHAGPGQRN